MAKANERAIYEKCEMGEASSDDEDSVANAIVIADAAGTAKMEADLRALEDDNIKDDADADAAVAAAVEAEPQIKKPKISHGKVPHDASGGLTLADFIGTKANRSRNKSRKKRDDRDARDTMPSINIQGGSDSSSMMMMMMRMQQHQAQQQMLMMALMGGLRPNMPLMLGIPGMPATSALPTSSPGSWASSRSARSGRATSRRRGTRPTLAPRILESYILGFI